MDGDTTAGYVEPPAVGDEASTLLGSLERQRATFRWKCADLDHAGLSARVGASTLTLGRLLKHLAYMEDLNFTGELGGAPLPEPWASVPEEGRSEWAFESADADSPQTLYALWDAAVARSRTALEAAVRAGGPGATFASGRESLRRLIVDFIEEYGRHAGQADLLRESVDGRVGEDPPGPVRAYELG
ncbi:mycothiol transferase [Luteipulveratus flavus]|uniref:DUF664 domain-containing protein n=1 Tax=Luteipulveratus flavus TaxID=3031728 RepID=A0ABT6CBS3_9MICO|nr:DUF664 domain-containing protein [Luteipulveratus sp. YIM 133296]MDF8266355.1 DUF664 domain-containing protein [Luteipulveratus sp. YIM 133296]